MLEPEVEPKFLDVGSWSQRLKFEFRLHSPAPEDASLSPLLTSGELSVYAGELRFCKQTTS